MEWNGMEMEWNGMERRFGDLWLVRGAVAVRLWVFRSGCGCVGVKYAY